MKTQLEHYTGQWTLSRPVPIASTFTSDVFKVEFKHSTAVLKIFNEKGRKFEAKGATVLDCFAGNGAVRLLKADEGAHLLEFADGPQLRTLVEQGRDDQATEVICDVLARIHNPSRTVPTGLISMKRNFKSLFSMVRGDDADSIFREGARIAERLIGTEREVCVLHGDIHHENILGSSRGWLALDPQCLAGERTYDTANTFYNPIGFLDLARKRNVIEQRSQIFSRLLNIDRKRILEYAFAYGCLSAAWSYEDGREEDTLPIAQTIWEMLKDFDVTGG